MFREMPQFDAGSESPEAKQDKLWARFDELLAISDMRPLTDTESAELNELKVAIAESAEEIKE
ncbi:MAG: hypothetical protein RLZZ347_694 [Candidatus Parcubacteria bacterium]|jgi:hypothetical protein